MEVDLTAGMAAGTVRLIQVPIRLPDILRPGPYRLAASVQSDLHEANPMNNIVVESGPVHGQAAITLRTSVAGPGALLDRPPGPYIVAKDSRIHLVPIADEKAYFLKWDGDVEGGVGATTVQMDRDRDVTAVFANYLRLAILVEGSGRVETDQDQDTLTIGAGVGLVAVPEPGWVFRKWSGDVGTTEPEARVTVDSDPEVRVHFDRTRQSYLDAHFTEPEKADPNVSGDLADPDQDGLNNLVESIFDLNPMSADREPLYRAYRDDTDVCLIFSRSRFLDGLTLRAAFSNDLKDWTSSGLTERIIGSDHTVDFVEVRKTTSPSAPVFFRLEISLPQPP